MAYKEILKDTLDELFNDLADHINSREDPFETPVLVFPNIKVEQWFKAKWLKTFDTVLMNVEYGKLNSILWDAFNIDDKYKQINSNARRDILIDLLSKQTGNKYYCKDGEINAIKLYDLANLLTDLFSDYDGDLFDCGADKWQKDLYDNSKKATVGKAEFVTLKGLMDINGKTRKTGQKIYVFGFTELNKLTKYALNKINENDEVTVFSQNPAKEIKHLGTDHLTCAPSKLREIEVLHSKICSIVKNSDANFSDFLVVAPDISEYENEIIRVFRQDNEVYPSLPFTINDKTKIDGDLSLSLKLLLDIRNKGFFTKLDFANLIKNKLVATVRNISDDEAEAFIDAILAMNVYRNSEEIDDWEYARTRLVLSKMFDLNQIDDNIAELSDGCNKSYAKPYASISLSDDGIVKFVKLIDDLKSWLALSKSKTTITKGNLEDIKAELDKWYSIKDEDGFETCWQYSKLISVFDSYETYVTVSNKAPLETLFYALIDASMSSRFNCGEAFSSGITFMNADVDSLISAKYVFLLGASSANIPHVYIKSELDLRKYDLNIEAKEINSLRYLYDNADEFYISYVGKNLTTDEDFYPSTFIIDLVGWGNLSSSDMEKEVAKLTVSIDENRDISELYTRKEFKYADYYQNLFKGGTKATTIPASGQEKMKKVTTSNMADFLIDPLKAKSVYLFGHADETNDELNKEYEPLCVDNLSLSKMITEVVPIIFAKGNIIDIDKDRNIIDEISFKYSLENRVSAINTNVQTEQIIYVIAFANACFELVTLYAIGKPLPVAPFELSYTTSGQQWILSLRNPYILATSADEKTRQYFEIKKPAKETDDPYAQSSEMMKLYIDALMDVSRLDEDEYTIILVRNGTSLIKKFTLTPTRAKELLSEIYTAMNDFSDNSYVPADILFNSEIGTLDDLIYNAEKNKGPWEYFKDKNMFDKSTQLGYTYDNFNKKFADEKEKMIKLVVFLDESHGRKADPDDDKI